MKQTVCIFQAFKRKAVFREGVGDCSICTPSPDNAKCKDFTKLTLYSFTAIDKEK